MAFGTPTDSSCVLSERCSCSSRVLSTCPCSVEQCGARSPAVRRQLALVPGTGATTELRRAENHLLAG